MRHPSANETVRRHVTWILEPELDLPAAGSGSIRCMAMPPRRDPV